METNNDDCIRNKITINELRKRTVSDDGVSNLSERYDLRWIQEVERISVNTRMSCIHGDLHIENVFVSDNDEPVLIDFGDVDDGSTALDPITLEFSMCTHPSTKDLIGCLTIIIPLGPI
jgi:Ser/Thr protein kinase RdoA (MazF antagonist)